MLNVQLNRPQINQRFVILVTGPLITFERMDFYETWHELHATRLHLIRVVYNFLLPILPTSRYKTCEVGKSLVPASTRSRNFVF
jgi:hypothetical protein